MLLISSFPLHAHPPPLLAVLTYDLHIFFVELCCVNNFEWEQNSGSFSLKANIADKINLY